MPQDQPLTFEKFVERDHLLPSHPRYDNFYLHFMPKGVLPLHLRKTPHFLKLQEEHPDLEARLTSGITNLGRTDAKALKPYEQDMYQSYLILRSYGVSDEDLLIGPKQ